MCLWTVNGFNAWYFKNVILKYLVQSGHNLRLWKLHIRFWENAVIGNMKFSYEVYSWELRTITSVFNTFSALAGRFCLGLRWFLANFGFSLAFLSRLLKFCLSHQTISSMCNCRSASCWSWRYRLRTKSKLLFPPGDHMLRHLVDQHAKAEEALDYSCLFSLQKYKIAGSRNFFAVKYSHRSLKLQGFEFDPCFVRLLLNASCHSKWLILLFSELLYSINCLRFCSWLYKYGFKFNPVSL